MVVNSNGRAYTQRIEPKLALVEIDLPMDAFKKDWKPTNISYMGVLYSIFVNLMLSGYSDAKILLPKYFTLEVKECNENTSMKI